MTSREAEFQRNFINDVNFRGPVSPDVSSPASFATSSSSIATRFALLSKIVRDVYEFQRPPSTFEIT